MNAARASLLFLVGALSAICAWAICVVLLFLRYSIPFPSLSNGMWFAFIGLPAIVGGISGLIFPSWQRATKVRNGALAAVSLAVVVALVIAPAQFLVVGWKEAIVCLTNLDFLVFLLSAIAGGLVFQVLRKISGDTQQTMAETMGRLRQTMGFLPGSTERLQGIALVFDVENFVTFYNQPWAKSSAPQYLDLVFSAITTELFGGRRFWGDKGKVDSFTRPVHQKFLGDGMLYIWTPPPGETSFSPAFVSELVRRLRRFGQEFPLVSEACKGSIPQSFELPKRIRFGVAGGLIYELTRKDSPDKEYVGFCINLAARLQGYCPGLGMIVSGSLNVPDETLVELGMGTIIATQIKGFADEPVCVVVSEFEALSDLSKSSHFFME